MRHAEVGVTRVDRGVASSTLVPFLHLDQAIARNGIEVIGGMTAATPAARPSASTSSSLLRENLPAR
jgi:hypothetical protein